MMQRSLFATVHNSQKAVTLSGREAIKRSRSDDSVAQHCPGACARKLQKSAHTNGTAPMMTTLGAVPALPLSSTVKTQERSTAGTQSRGIRTRTRHCANPPRYPPVPGRSPYKCSLWAACRPISPKVNSSNATSQDKTQPEAGVASATTTLVSCFKLKCDDPGHPKRLPLVPQSRPLKKQQLQQTLTSFRKNGGKPLEMGKDLPASLASEHARAESVNHRLPETSSTSSTCGEVGPEAPDTTSSKNPCDASSKPPKVQLSVSSLVSSSSSSALMLKPAQTPCQDAEPSLRNHTTVVNRRQNDPQNKKLTAYPRLVSNSTASTMDTGPASLCTGSCIDSVVTAAEVTNWSLSSSSSLAPMSSQQPRPSGEKKKTEHDVDAANQDEDPLAPLEADRQILDHRELATSSLCDTAAYGHLWILHQRQREEAFQPWQPILSGKSEQLRLSTIAAYWESAKTSRVALQTIYVAVSGFNRLLTSWTPDDLRDPSLSCWAMTAVVAYRLACKLEERPEILWEISNIWELFPLFSDWSLDRSDASLNRVTRAHLFAWCGPCVVVFQAELLALRTLGDTVDIPLAPMFLSLYLTAGGWPSSVAKDYCDLGLYILGLSTFASTKDHLLKHVVPSKLAAAALVLAIKIVNSDRASSCGVLPHLAHCPRAILKPTQAEPVDDAHRPTCLCRYEFFPERLKLYSNLSLLDIQPIIRGLSCLLRTKPDHAYALKHFFPLWAEHDWQ